MTAEMFYLFLKEFNFLIKWGYKFKEMDIFTREPYIIYYNSKTKIRIEFHFTDHMEIMIRKYKFLSCKEIKLDHRTYLLYGNEDITRYFHMPFGIQKNAVFMKEKLCGLLNGKGWDKIKNEPFISIGE